MADTITCDEAKSLARTALARSPIHDLRHLQVEHAEDALLISGRVASFYHSQLAQELVRAVVGTTKVVNSIDVG